MISLDTETTGIDLHHSASPFLVTICDSEGINHWWEWPVDPETRKVQSYREDLRDIQRWIDDNETIVLQNVKFDYQALQVAFGGKLRWDSGKVRDTLLSGHLLASNQPHDLASMALQHLGVDIQPLENALVKACKEARIIVKTSSLGWRIAKAGLPEMPSAKETVHKYDYWLPRAIAQYLDFPLDHPWWTVCSEYANGDSSVTLSLWQSHEALLKERGLWEIYLERLRILPVITGIENARLTLSASRLIESKARYGLESLEAANVCYKIAEGYKAELVLPKSGNNNSLKEFLFDTMQLPVVKTTDKGGASLDKEAMAIYEVTLEGKPLEFIKALQSKRKRDTAVAYLEGYQRFWLKNGSDGFYELHSSLNATGSDTLRFSSSNPNQTNISKKEDFNLRYVFGPAPGREWYSIDYNNLELRIPAYEADEEKMIAVFEKPNDPPYFGSYHLLNASIVYPDLFWPLAEKEGAFKSEYKATWYQWIKNFGFAVQYGAQQSTADRSARKQGAYAAVQKEFKKIAELNQRCIHTARKLGYVETIPDKEVCPHRGYPILCRRSSWGDISPTLPLNYHVQGTACLIAMRAMVKVQEYLDTIQDVFMVMYIHDELVFDFPVRKPGMNLFTVNRIRGIMESLGTAIGVPLTCGVTRHLHNWSEGVSV